MEDIHLNFNEDGLRILNICIGFVMFGIALDLTIADFKRLIQYPKKALTGIVSQFVLMPAATFVLVWILQPAAPMALGMLLVAACPGGNVSNFICHMSKGNTALSVTLTAFSTLLAIVLTPLNFGFWSSMLPAASSAEQAISIHPWDMFQTILLIILIPLVLGMLTNRFLHKVTLKIRKPMKFLSIIIFLGFLVIAFYNNMDVFAEHFQKVIWLVLAHNAVALAIGYGFARVMKLEERDRRTIAIETGIQNSALGLVLIFNFFDGNGGMALVAAWWGIWHIVSGFILAWYWTGKRALPDTV